MKNKLNKLSDYLKFDQIINDKRVVIFLVCLFIATLLWFLNALSKDYSTTLSYPVKFINPPSNQFLANEPEDRLELKVNAHGFTLLRHKLSLSFSPIILNISNLTKNLDSRSGRHEVNTNNLIRAISDQVSSEIQITAVRPERIVLVLDSLATKEVPVIADVELKFKDQFDLSGSVRMEPPAVQITGPAAILDTIDKLSTEKVLYEDLDADLNRTIKILYPKSTSLKPTLVNIFAPIEKFTEKEIIASIQVKNAKAEQSIKLFPSSIKLSILVGLSEFRDISASDFDVYIDYADYSEESETLPVYVIPVSSHIKIIRHSPESVEFLIETN